MKDGAPIPVTLVKPSAIATPFTRHARNHTGREPDLPPPVYDAKGRRDSLYRPSKGDGDERMEHDRHVMRTSAYASERLHPLQTALAVPCAR